jgi:hypothetical protein
LAEFRRAFLQDLHAHPLAWALIVAGAATAVLLWASIAGLPLLHHSPAFDVDADAAAAIWWRLFG